MTTKPFPRFSLDYLYGLDDTQIDLVYLTTTEIDAGIPSAALPDDAYLGSESRLRCLELLSLVETIS